jgi:predicted nucleic acid-binding protein
LGRGIVPLKPIFLDTSVVLRILIGEPEDSARIAEASVCQAIDAGREVLVSDLVVLEAYFALQHHYGISKVATVKNLRALFEADGIAPENGDSIIEVLDSMLSGASKPGLVDRLIHARAAKAQAELYTFEKASRRLPGVKVLG